MKENTFLKKSAAIMLSAAIALSGAGSSFALEMAPESGVVLDKEWEVSFSGEVDWSTVSGNVSIIDSSGQDIRVESRVDGSKVYVNPMDSMEYGADYSVVVRPGVMSKGGETIGEIVSKSFTTISYDSLKKSLDHQGDQAEQEYLSQELGLVQQGAYSAADTYREASVLTAKVLGVNPSKVSHETWSAAVDSALALWNQVDMDSGQLEDECDALVQKAEQHAESSQMASLSAYDKDEITAVFDAAPAGKKIKTLANHLGVDARRAFAMLKMSQEELKAQAWNDAGDAIQTLENTATVIKDGSKVALFVGGAVLTGGAVSGSMTIGEAGAALAAAGKAGAAQIVREGGAALVASGVDLMLEVSSDSAAIAFGRDNGYTAMVTQVRDVTAPVSGIIGFYGVKNTASAADWVCNSFMIADMEREALQEGKLFGIQVTNEPLLGGGTQDSPRNIEMLNINETVEKNVKEGLENWMEEKVESSASASVDEITGEEDFEMQDGETFEQGDVEPEEDKAEDKTGNATSFGASISGVSPSYTVSVDTGDAQAGTLFAISIVQGQGVIHGMSAQAVQAGSQISWGFGMFAGKGDTLLKVKRMDTGEYEFISVPGYDDEEGGDESNDDYETQMDIDYSKIVEKEFAGNDGKYYVIKYYSDDDLERWQGRCEIYYDSSKSQLYELSYRIDGYKTGPCKSYHSNGELLEQGSYHLEMDSWYSSLKDGQWLKYSSEGVLLQEKNYSMGDWDGVQKTYSASGELIREENYLDGQKHGAHKEWYGQSWESESLRGKLKLDANYSYGQRHGTWTSYDYYSDALGGGLSSVTVTQYQSGDVASTTTTRYGADGTIIE